MAYTATFGRVSAIEIRNIQTTAHRTKREFDIPGEYGSAFIYGVKPKSFVLSCQFRVNTDTAAQTKYRQLQELCDNPLIGWDYIAFPQNMSENDGFYLLESVDAQTENWHGTRYFPFAMNVTKIGNLSTLQPSTYWYGYAPESYTGWTTLASSLMVALPNGATYPTETVDATRTTSDGTVTLANDPVSQTIQYVSSSTIANWFKSECKVYDTVTAGNTTEATWVQVFSEFHIFAGDRVIQNGLLRLIEGAASTWYVYDSVTTSAWVSMGQLYSYLTGPVAPVRTQWSIKRLSPDVVEWIEWRQTTAGMLKLAYTLRRGAYHCRVVFSVGAVAMYASDPSLYKVGGFTYLFNSVASGTSASFLALDTTNSYECGYNLTDSVIAGFVLLDQPAYQPATGAGDYLLSSQTAWTTNHDYTVFLIGWPASYNAVLNPGFETAGGGGADVFLNWSEIAGTGAIANETSIVHSGGHSAKLTAGASANTMVTQDITVVPGDAYSITFWARGDGTNAGQYNIYDLTHSAYIVATTTTGVTAATWTKVTVAFVVPAACTSIRISLRNTSVNGTSCYFDDVTLFDYASARAQAATIASQALYAVEQKLITPYSR